MTRAGERGERVPAWVVPVAAAGAVGMVAGVASWMVAPQLTPGYDLTRQAISELFARGAPTGPASLVRGGLLVSVPALVGLAIVFHRVLPGRRRLGPVLTAIAGVMTFFVVVFPCSAGCPGRQATTGDLLHSLSAGIGYVALIGAPLAIAHRVRRERPGLALASMVMGGAAALGIVVWALDLVPGREGLEQRLFNGIADAWYVVAAAVVIRIARARQVTAG